MRKYIKLGKNVLGSHFTKKAIEGLSKLLDYGEMNIFINNPK